MNYNRFVTRTTFKFAKRTLSSKHRGGDVAVTGPTEKLKSWESGARLVKNTTVENQYLEHIREVHDPSLHLKTIEDELKGTIGKALGKQGEKVLMHMRLMDEELRRYKNLVAEHGESSRLVLDSAKTYNDHRKRCIHARWELIVHRQAVGFIVGNHQYVMEKFRIAEALPEETAQGEATNDEGDKETNNASNGETKKKKFGTQLDWWQKIGRWR